MRKYSYVVPAALAAFLSAGSAFAGLQIKNDGTTVWDAKASANSCVYAAAPSSDRTIANDGTVIGDVKASKRVCVKERDYKNLTSEQFNDLAASLSTG